MLSKLVAGNNRRLIRQTAAITLLEAETKELEQLLAWRQAEHKIAMQQLEQELADKREELQQVTQTNQELRLWMSSNGE